MIEIIGRFHPLIVHLPIGFILIAAIFQYVSLKKKYVLQDAIRISLFVGMLSALCACITGYISSGNQEESTTMMYHFYLGLITFVFSFIAWIAHRLQKKYAAIIVYSLVCLVCVTGHFGGSLTHGEDYLFPKKNNYTQSIIHNVDSAYVYEDIINPILADHCFQCHSSVRQKGKLRMDEYSFLLKGGKNGPAIISNLASKSLIVERMILPLNDENHMPPKTKPQPSMDEITLIQWWINNGAKTGVKAMDITQDDKIKSILTKLTNTKTEEIVLPELPNAPDAISVKFLNDKGTSIQPLSKSSNLLLVNFIANDSITKDDIAALNKIKDHIYILKMGHTTFDKKFLSNLSMYKNLQALYLEDLGLIDADCTHLEKLPALEYLNVTSNKLTLKGIENICKIKTLKKLYMYQNNVTQSEIDSVKGKGLEVFGG